MKKTLLLLCLLVLGVLSSCSLEKKARKAYEYAEYQKAIDLYGKLLDKRKNQARANYFIADSYRLSNRLQMAEPYYKKAMDSGISNDSVGLYYAFALKANEKYKDAAQQLDNYVAGTENEAYVQRANKEMENLSLLNRLKEEKSYYRIKNLEAINSDQSEYSPVFFDGYLYFTSSRDNKLIYNGTGTPYTDIFKVKTKGANVDIATLESMDDIINLPDVHEASITFSPDGNTVVFARSNTGKRKGRYDVSLYLSHYRKEAWTEPRLINVNQLNPQKVSYWNSTPAFSRDGKTLYFSSNRPRGKGGTDIYSAKMNSRGRFSKPKNLGAAVNTEGNESFPFVSSDGKLYFSSDGHAGFGGLDLFVAKRERGKTTVKNLGKPVNSSADDFGMFLFKPDKGFFCSNRPGGKGDDDIYTFINEDPDLKEVNYFLKGLTKTYGEDGKSTKLLPSVTVKLLDAEGNTLEETTSNRQGEFSFRVYEEEDYDLVAEKHGKEVSYLTTRGDFTTIGKSKPKSELVKLITNVTFDTLMVLEKLELHKHFVLENILYDLDKWDIRTDAALELDKLVVLLKDNPEIKIELSSHTDNRAPDEYNMTLSEKRARSAVDYLISQGIDKKRLVAKGYGESQLIIKNAVTEEQHQVNRRTEFEILAIDPSKKPKTLDENGKEVIEEVDEEDRFFDDDNGR